MADTCIQRPELSDVGFTVDDFSVFYRPQWPKFPCIVLAVYRVVVALYVIGFFIGLLVISAQHQGGESFVYLTTLGFMIFIAYNVTAAVNVIWDGYIRRRNPVEEVRIRHKTHWFFFSMTTNLNFLITIVYWSALYMPSIPLIYDLTMHTLTSVVCFVDLFLMPIPVRFLHFIYPLLLGTVYLVFTLIFWAAGGFGKRPIYPFLDYSNNPGLAVGAIIGIFVAIVLMQGAIWVLYKLRFWIWVKCGNSTQMMWTPWTESRVEESPEGENSVDDRIIAEQI